MNKIERIIMQTNSKLSGVCRNKLTAWLAAIVIAGCATVPHEQTVQQVCDLAAFDVCDELLVQKPERRAAFEAALGELKTLQAQPRFDALALTSVLRRVPVAALQSRRARIGFDTAEGLIVIFGDRAVTPKGESLLRAANAGFISGLERRLNLGASFSPGGKSHAGHEGLVSFGVK